MTRIDSILNETLISKGLVSKEGLASCVKESEETKQSLTDILVKRNLISEQLVLQALSERLALPLVNLKTVLIDKKLLEKVPLKIAQYYKFIPLEIKDRYLTIAVSSPLDIKIQDEIRTQLGFDIEMALASRDDIANAIKEYYGLAAETLEKISSKAQSKEAYEEESSREKVEDIEKLAGDASVIRLVNQIILEAWRKRATDIHIEPYRQGVYLRYRIDGILYDASVPADFKHFISAIISRIKIMSNLNIVERRLPQDGRAMVKVQEQMLDLRISTIPTPFGESVVIRILPTQMLFSLEKLGLSKSNLLIFENLVVKPHGIIFVTGPTGSGKTTTLYACLSKINTRERKIITIEDPIEYEMAGVTQIQVLPEIGLDFARGLRSILRHDPDVIMVGEVRDLETAEIAIRVALTGHLVFSTLHTNDAASGITRLVDIGVEPYLVASSVEAFIAQRLIRVICPDCKYEVEAVPVELKEMIARDLGLKSKGEVRVFRGRGCSSCNFTGFYGRTAIYEVLLVDETMKDLIVRKTSASQIKKYALQKGMVTLRQDGWQKTILGFTTPEEVMKVTSVEEYEEESSALTAVGRSYPEALEEQPLNADNRVYHRLHSRVNLRYKIFKSAEELIQRGFSPEQLSVTTNISAGGVLFVSLEPIAIGAFLELTVELPDGSSPIECLAKTVRVEEGKDQTYNIAICFLDISSAERARLDKYVISEHVSG